MLGNRDLKKHPSPLLYGPAICQMLMFLSAIKGPHSRRLSLHEFWLTYSESEMSRAREPRCDGKSVKGKHRNMGWPWSCDTALTAEVIYSGCLSSLGVKRGFVQRVSSAVFMACSVLLRHRWLVWYQEFHWCSTRFLCVCNDLQTLRCCPRGENAGF